MSKATVFWALASFSLPLFGDAVTNKWAGTVVDNTPVTAVDFHAGENWKNGVFSYSADFTYVGFENVSNTKSRYVKVSSPVELSYLKNNNGNIFIGTEIAFSSTDTNLRPGMGSGVYPPYYYVDFVLKRFGKSPWFGAGNFCGNVDVTQSNHDFIFSSGTQKFRADCFAPNSNPKRDGLLVSENTKVSTGSASIVFVAPFGCDEHTVTCSQTQGSPYLLVKEGSDLAVGAIVSGEGIPEGTYLKRVFPDNYIELSENAASTSDSNVLTVSAFAPDFKQCVKNFYRQGDDKFYNVAVVKHREVDNAVLEIANFWVSSDKTKTAFGCESGSGEIPGVIHLHKVQRCGQIQLKNANILFDAPTDASVPGFFNAINVAVVEKCTANLIVPDGVEAIVSNVIDIAGTLTKKESGKLTLVFDTDKNQKGTVVAEAGILEFKHKSAQEAARRVSLGKIAAKAGAELHLDNIALDVRAVAMEQGIRITGSGTINVTSTDNPISFEGVILDPGIKLVTTMTDGNGAFIDGDVAGQIPGHPAFWVDASKPESIVYETVNGTNFVTRWNDWRAGETMFCTNIMNRPQFFNGDEMAGKYVRLGNRSDITDLKQSEHLVWNVPLYDIRAVFLVEDPVEGGGEVLGRCSWRLSNSYTQSRGGAYYKDGSKTHAYNATSKNTSDSVRYGRCFINGFEVSSNPLYANGGKGIQLIEHHVNTNYPTSPTHWTLAADAFGCGYENVTDSDYLYIRRSNGGMRISEYIIFTNSLTYAERVQVEQYLMKKWLGRDVAYRQFDVNANKLDFAIESDKEIDLNVAEGVSTVKSVSGTGLLSKSGEGGVYIDNFDGAKLNVKEGEVILNTLVTSSDNLLAYMKRRTGFSPWLFVDAAKPSTLTVNSDNGVTRWDDVSGNGVRLEKKYSRSTVHPTIRYNFQNNLPLIDFGERYKSDTALAENKNPLFYYVKADGTRYNHLTSGTDAPKVKTAFFIANSSGGGGSLFGADGNGYPYYGLPNMGSDSPVLSVGSSFVSNLNNHMGLSKWVYRLNGSDFNPLVENFSGQTDLFLFSSKNNEGRDGITFGGTYGYSKDVGGLMYGEILLYSDMLLTNDYLYVEAYMQNKWFNRKTSGMNVAEVSDLAIEEDAKVSLYGGNTINLGGVSGGGTLEADVAKLNDNCVIGAVVGEDGEITAFKVEGSVYLPRNVTIKVSGALDGNTQGSYTLLSAGQIFGDNVKWTFDAPAKPVRTYSVTKTDSAIILSIGNPATILMLK